MILDKKSLFSDAQAFTATANSQSVDLGDDIGHGNLMGLNAAVVEDFTGLTSVQAILQDSDDNSNFADVLSTAAVPVAKLKAGYRFAIDAIPCATRRYVRLRYVVAGTGTGGKISAGVTPTLQNWYSAGQKLGGQRTY